MVAASEKSLAEILFQQQQLGEAIPVPLTLAILRQVCESLDWAHNLTDANGYPLYILHRDVSPVNIYVGHTGAVRLVASTATEANCGYVAPEILVGMNPDPRADLFSLGVVAHEMLVNRRLFLGANDHDTLSRVCTFPIPLPSTINPAVTPDIEGIVLMALARDPMYRWQSAAMMRDGFASVAQRNGFELGPEAAHLWYALFMGQPAPRPEPQLPSVQFSGAPEPQVIAPPAGGRPMEPPPQGEWSDDTNNETQIQLTDPRLQDIPASPPWQPVARQTPVPEPRSSPPHGTPPPEPSHRTPRPEARSPEQGTPQPSHRTPRPEARSPEQGTPQPRSAEPPHRTPRPEARSPEQGTPQPRSTEPSNSTPRPEPRSPESGRIPRPEPRSSEPPSRTPRPELRVDDLPAPVNSPKARPADEMFADLPSPRAKQPTGGAAIKPASDALFEDLPSPRAKQPTGQPPPVKPGSESLFEDLPAPKKGAGSIADLPGPKGDAALFANLPAPRAPEQPNQRGVALEDLPPAPEKPRPAPKPVKPARAPDPFEAMDLPSGKQQPRASTADIDAFVASVADDPDLDQVSHVPASAPPPAMMFAGAPPPAQAFELELGEFTQIGAAPLIQFGNTGETPIALVGVGPKQPPPRTSAPTLPPPLTIVVGTRVGDDDDDDGAGRKKLLMIILGGVLVIVAAVVAFVLVS